MNNPASSQQKQELTKKGRNDRQLVFSGLYDQYAPSLLGVLTKLVRDKEEALVLLETSFLAIHTKFQQADTDKSPMFVGLLHIARRTALDALAKRQQVPSTRLHLTESGSVSIAPPPTNIPSLVKPIPPDTSKRAFLNSVMFDDCTPEEAATNLAIPVELARQQLRLAIREVRASQTN